MFNLSMNQSNQNIDHNSFNIANTANDSEIIISLLQTLLSTNLHGIITTNLKGKIVLYNRKLIEILEISEIDLLNKNNSLQFRRIFYKKLNNYRQLFDIFQAIKNMPNAEIYENLILKDGRILEIFTYPQYLDQNIIGRLWSLRYVTVDQPTEQHIKKPLTKENLILASLSRIRASLKLDDILHNTVDEVRQFLGTDRVLIYEFSPDWSGQVVVESVINPQLSIVNEYIYDPCFSDQLIEPYQLGRIRAIKDIFTENILQCHKDLLIKYQVRANLVVPILQKLDNCDQSILWGLLISHHCTDERDWSALEIDLLQQLALQVGIALHQSSLYEKLQKANNELQRLANVDGLTQIANRRYFDQVLKQECDRPESKPLSLILCDIDYFKIYNDTYGHQVGDRCLQEVAKSIETSLTNPQYLVARYGGEELVVILPNTNMTDAIAIGEKIRENLRTLGIAHINSPISQYVTLSLGITTTQHNLFSPSELIKSADQALYEAKNNGRDQLIFKLLE